MKTSSRLTIFEGPDGSGKSTLAKLYASATGARLVHSGPFPRVVHSLARFYVEAMLPALLGFEDVVLDRAWMSERVYGETYRDRSRLDATDFAMLERLAARCETRVVLACPKLEVCLKTFRARRSTEYVSKEKTLRAVHAAYADADWDLTRLPHAVYDYTRHGRTPAEAAAFVSSAPITKAHPLRAQTGGYLEARTVILGEAFGEPKEHDPLYRVPFVSFSSEGCSRWLTEIVMKTKTDLLWANADMDLDETLDVYPRSTILALGAEAAKKARDLRCVRRGTRVVEMEHPQSFKRFKARKPYPLVKHLKEIS